MTLTIACSTLTAPSTQFKLESGTSTGGAWTDVGSTVSFKFFNNPSVAAGGTLSAPKLSCLPILQSYIKNSPTPLNPNAIAVSGKGEWDFALDAAAAQNTYYIRRVKSDGTLLTAYTVYPVLTITAEPTMDSTIRHGTFFAGEAKQPQACSYMTTLT